MQDGMSIVPAWLKVMNSIYAELSIRFGELRPVQMIYTYSTWLQLSLPQLLFTPLTSPVLDICGWSVIQWDYTNDCLPVIEYFMYTPLRGLFYRDEDHFHGFSRAVFTVIDQDHSNSSLLKCTCAFELSGQWQWRLLCKTRESHLHLCNRINCSQSLPRENGCLGFGLGYL